ncbi:MAG TPA: oligosaccharide flippase family protein [Chitinophagaceae bacterium]|nr:oligosaccharide flippase family protein [Chitinophagaceae bacterium]
MGIVRKQSIHSSLFIYLGFVIGAFNFWLLPHILTTEQFGLVRVLISVCTLLAGLCSLGSLQVITRFYPYYNTQGKKHKNDLLGWALILGIIGFAIMVILTQVYKGLVIRKFEGKSPLFIDYFYLIYPFTFFILFFGIYERIAWSRQFTVLSSFLRETGVRLFTLIIVILLAVHWINFNYFISWYSLQFGVVFLVLFAYVTIRKGTHITVIPSETTRQLYRQMGTYAAYIFGGGLFMLVEQYFNTILLGSRVSLDAAGIFDIASFIATFLLVPKRSIQAAASATIARAWKEDDTGRIDRIYRKSSATLLISGILILGLIWLNIDHLFDLYRPEYRAGKYVVLFIGLANLIDLATGLNYDILVNSKLWKLHFIVSVCMVAFFLPVTYFFVKAYGMMGSAYGILISLGAYNIVRSIILWWKFKMQPFSLKSLLILVTGVVAYFIAADILPVFHNIFMDIIIKSLVFLLLFATAVLGARLSDDVSELYAAMLVRLKIRK